MNDHSLNLGYAAGFHRPDPVMDAARTLASDYSVVPVSWTVAGLIETLASSASVASAVEVGTGTGVASLALLRGMPASGILTSIDVDAERQSAARDLLRIAKIRPHRFRTITGRAENVLGTLADGSYDLVLLDGEPLSLPRLIEPAVALLRPGGLLLINQALLGGAVPQPADRDPRTQAVRAALKDVRNRDDIVPFMLPTAEGLLIARRV